MFSYAQLFIGDRWRWICDFYFFNCSPALFVDRCAHIWQLFFCQVAVVVLQRFSTVQSYIFTPLFFDVITRAIDIRASLSQGRCLSFSHFCKSLSAKAESTEQAKLYQFGVRWLADLHLTGFKNQIFCEGKNCITITTTTLVLFNIKWFFRF